MALRIPQMEAHALYNGYLVNLAATPMTDNSGSKLANSWLELATNGIKGAGAAAGNTMAQAFAKVQQAFGDRIRD